MLIHVFNGAREGEHDVDLLADAVLMAAESGGHQTVPWTLRDHDFSFCRGCFSCWVATPGTCNGTHADRDVARRLADADVVVFTTPLTFGCYSPQLKIALDHLLPMLTFEFERWAGETHHPLRYGRFPPILAVASATTRDAGAERIFSTMLWRNSFSSRAPSAAAVFSPGDGLDQIVERLAAILAGLTGRPSRITPSDHVPTPELPHLVPPEPLILADVGPGDAVADPQPPKRALLLVGSPKPGLRASTPDDRSASLALGRALARRLAGQGVEGRTLFLSETVRLGAATEQMLASVAAADLLVLSFPLSVDSLPAPAIEALELIANARRLRAGQNAQPRPGFFALCQSGFPEAEQSAAALAICRRFAHEAGFAWRGGLAIGGGPALASRLRPGGPARHALAALDAAASALAAGQAAPPEVVKLAARPIMPALRYRLAAEREFRRQARQHGVRRPSASRPFEPQGS
jgi:multimeric flavodoxin WrbA